MTYILWTAYCNYLKFGIKIATTIKVQGKFEQSMFIYLFILLIFTLFTVKLKLLIYTKKSFYRLYSNNIELIDVNSVPEEEM